jgi:FkbM family methyltransferase
MLDDRTHTPPATGEFDGEPTYERDGLTLRCARWYQDYNAVKDVRAYARLPIEPGDTVLDLGASIGAFPMLVALPAGASRVVCVEPEPRNYALLVHNTRNAGEVETRPVGVSWLGGPVPLYLSTASGMGHSTFVRRGREAIEMQTVTLASLLDELRPAIVKVDVEGAEYGLGLDELPPYVRGLAVEFHYLGSPKHRSSAQALVPRIEASGLRAQRPVNVSGSNWNPTAVFERCSS